MNLEARGGMVWSSHSGLWLPEGRRKLPWVKIIGAVVARFTEADDWLLGCHRDDRAARFQITDWEGGQLAGKQ